LSFGKPHPPFLLAMLITTGMLGTVYKHRRVTTMQGEGGGAKMIIVETLSI